MPEFINIGFYQIDTAYLRFLHNADPEVYFDPSYIDKTKPYIGIIVSLGKYDYFIPLSSAKKKHSHFALNSAEHILITKRVSADKRIPDKVYKQIQGGQWIQILALIDIKKMIPVPPDVYQKIDFSSQKADYRSLLQMEYRFCLQRRDNILQKAGQLYKNQFTTGVVRHKNVSFSLCEKKLQEWSDHAAPKCTEMREVKS